MCLLFAAGEETKQSERGSEKEEREKESEMNNSSSGWRRFTYGEPQQRRLRAATTAGDMAGAAERDDELNREAPETAIAQRWRQGKPRAKGLCSASHPRRK